MKIAVIVEGSTEVVFKPKLIEFLRPKLDGKMPSLHFIPQGGRVPKGDKLKKLVENLLDREHDAVIALTDVYTGTDDFSNAADAKGKMRQWVGTNDKFFPHAAQHDFEAWLIPYWATIRQKTGHNSAAPTGAPETVNHNNPPAKRIANMYQLGTGRNYIKPKHALAILKDNDLMVSVIACPELKSFVNTIISLSGGQTIP